MITVLESVAETADNFSERTLSFVVAPVAVGGVCVVSIGFWPNPGTAGISPPTVTDPDNPSHVFTRIHSIASALPMSGGTQFYCVAETPITSVRFVPDPHPTTGEPQSGGYWGNWGIERLPAATLHTFSSAEGSGNAPKPGAMSVTATDYVMVAILATRNLAADATNPSGWTASLSQPDNNNHMAGVIAHSPNESATGTIDLEWSTGASSNTWNAMVAVFEAAEEEPPSTDRGRVLVGARRPRVRRARAVDLLRRWGPKRENPAASADIEPSNFFRIDNVSTCFVDIDDAEVGDTILVAMDAWNAASGGIDPQSSWLTDNNGATAGDYLNEASVLATDGRTEVGNNNTPGVALFRRVVTSAVNLPYRITATGSFEWGGLVALRVRGMVAAAPRGWSKAWWPTAETVGTSPPYIPYGSVIGDYSHGLQFGAAHNSGHGQGLEGPGEGGATVLPPEQSGTTGYVVIAEEAHNSNHLAFHCWYRVVNGFETMTPLQPIDDEAPTTIQYVRGVQAFYAFTGGNTAVRPYFGLRVGSARHIRRVV